MIRTIIPFPYFSIDITNFPYVKIFNNHDDMIAQMNNKIMMMQEKIDELEAKLKDMSPPIYPVTNDLLEMCNK